MQPRTQIDKIAKIEQDIALTHNDMKHMKEKIDAIENKVDN